MQSGDLIAEMLIGYGVQYIFGIPGGQTLPLYNAVARRRDRIQHILVRDERTGPYAADAFARVSRRLAVCDAVPGPGVVKLPSGLSEAQTTSVPLICIAGDLQQDWRRYARYACAAQGVDQVALLSPVSKVVIPVSSQATLPDALRQAFREATTGRPGPVVINVPADVFSESWDPEILPATVDPTYGHYPAQRPRPSTDTVHTAVDILLAAQRPVLVVGGGGLISGAEAEVEALAQALAIPVATTVTGKGTLREDHPLSVGVVGGQYAEDCANDVVRDADVVFLVGYKSSQQSTFLWLLPAPHQRILHLDIDPYEIGKIFATEVGMVGDARTGLRDVLDELRQRKAKPPDRTDWLAHVQAAKATWQAEVNRQTDDRSPILPQRVMRELQRQMAPEDILVSDASFAIGWVASYFDVRSAGRRCLFPRGSATLGFGLPAAIGARLADPEHRVVCVAGDGGIGYALSELSTCRKYDLAITVVILNNSCLGYSKWGERLGDQNFGDVEFPPTNFATIARGFGCQGIRVETPGQLAGALAVALRADTTTVVDVAVDEWATPELNLREHLAVATS